MTKEKDHVFAEAMAGIKRGATSVTEEDIQREELIGRLIGALGDLCWRLELGGYANDPDVRAARELLIHAEGL